MNEVYPNFMTAYELFLTIPVCVVTCERSFSKLKLIKTYLRSSTSHARLSSLALRSIESSVAEELNYDSIVTAFADKKARRTGISRF